MTNALFIIPREVLDMHPPSLSVVPENEERGLQISTR